MTEQNINNGNARMQDTQEEFESMPTFSIQDIIDMMLDKWYWFVISVVLCVGIGCYYIASTPKVYKRQATILVKDSRKGGSNDISAFSDIIGMPTRRNVDNELYILQSRRLMIEVVNRLGLTTRYTTKERLRVADLYGRSPIEASLIDNFSGQSCAFNVELEGNDKISITNFRGKDLERADRKYVAEGAFGDTISTPVGKILVNKTLYMTPEYEGRVISVSKGSDAVVASAYRTATQSSVANKQSSIITISLNDNVPKRAEDILNTLIQVYNDDAISDKQRISEATAEFINDRLHIISKELGAVDKDIESFKKNNQLFDLETEATRVLTESTKFKTEGLSVENQIQIAKYIRDYLRNDKKGSSLIPTTTTFSGNSGTAINSQIEAYNMAILRREKLIANSTENSPVIQELDRDMASIRNAILASLDSHISALEIQLAGIRHEEQRANMRISAAPSQEKQYLTIARQQRIKEELYLYLLNKREENALTIAITESNARIVDPAFGSVYPIHPRSIIILLIALAVGLVVPFAIIYLMAALDTTIKGRKDIERYLSVPYLGDIPLYEGSTRNSVVVRENGRDSISEAFRILRTNMSFMNGRDQKSRVIQITSSNPHAGKTFVSTNLAVTLAMSGRKVLLMDLDLRRRTLSKQLGHRNDPNGLTAYMSGNIGDIDKVTVKSDLHDNLDMMYAGLQPPNPAEMLMSENLDKLFDELRRMYDFIIIDSVPALAVADAMITNRLSDICIYVVREGMLDRRQLPDIENMYREHKLANMCIVLNGASMTKRGYGYGYGYYYYSSTSDDYSDNIANTNILRSTLNRIKSIFGRKSKHKHRHTRK